MNYFYQHGRGYPDTSILFSLDSRTEKQIRQVIQSVLDPRVLQPYLAQPNFRKWINGTIQKGFRSYTNPTAMKLLMEHFGADLLPVLYPNLIEPFNQYLFVAYYNYNEADENLRQAGNWQC
jgi:hypothetical protein